MSERPAKPCKCCGGAAYWFGAADFSKTCEDRNGPVFAPSGQAVDYYRCTACGFLFTDLLDDWSSERLKRDIYNEDYVKADPEITGVRAARIAEIVEDLCGAWRDRLRIFDYGGGTGGLVDELRRRGFRHVDGGDPFFGEPRELPRGLDLMLCIEVLEHLVRPADPFVAAQQALGEDAALLVTTVVQPVNIAGHGAAWWYLAPRNGHISLHSRDSLHALAARHGFRIASLSEGTHLAWRGVPRFAAPSPT